MTLGVIGTGHVGLITCLSLSSVGHRVVGYDLDAAKISTLRDGRMPFHEPGGREMLGTELASGRLSFSDDIAEAVSGADVVFICVGTPIRASGEANLLAVEQAARQIAQATTGPLVVVEKSTVPPGTATRLERTLAEERPDLVGQLDLLSNPEFLREGRGLEDALARVCEAAGADIEAVTRVLGGDPRIGPDFLGAGIGFGGYCLPKDLAAFAHMSERLGYPFPLLAEVARINDEAVQVAVAKIREVVWNLEGKRIALLGLSFKPDTDDVRFSPALALARALLTEGASVVGFDPVAGGPARDEVPELEVADDAYAAAAGASCVVICTGWPEFRELDLERLGGAGGLPTLVGGRNLLDPAAVTEAGWTYRAMGRPTILTD